MFLDVFCEYIVLVALPFSCTFHILQIIKDNGFERGYCGPGGFPSGRIEHEQIGRASCRERVYGPV